jgi:hypothetical protein
MDTDLYNLNLIFLQKAREWLAAGEDHRVVAQLGLDRTTAALLKRLPLAELQALAASDKLYFTLRIPPQAWIDLARSPSVPWPEAVQLQLLASAMAPDADECDEPA